MVLSFTKQRYLQEAVGCASSNNRRWTHLGGLLGSRTFPNCVLNETF